VHHPAELSLTKSRSNGDGPGKKRRQFPKGLMKDCSKQYFFINEYGGKGRIEHLMAEYRA
jgi:hypothetical protein